MCLSIVYIIDCYFLYCLSSIDVEPESEIPPEAEDTQFDPYQQGKQPLIDHVDKNPFPSHSRLCMIRSSPCYVLSLVEPIPLHDLSFCHSSKLTTILADLGVD